MQRLLLPGLIDPHVHLRDFDEEHKEDFTTGTAAAIAGGYTTILDMPNNRTPITTFERLQTKRSLAKEKILCDVGFYFGSQGDNTQEFEKVSGFVHGLKLYLNHTTGNFLLHENKLLSVFSRWPAENGPILLHAEDDMLTTVINVVKQTNKRAHICHVSREVELKSILEAKEQGLPITCGVTPHHLFLTENDEKRLGPFALMKPSLGTKKDQDFLWKHLNAIDVIESDHAPHTKEEKENTTPCYGVPGLETTLPLLLTAMSNGRITLDEILRLCFENPKKIFSVVTDETTSVQVDLQTSYAFSSNNLHTKNKWSPFEGMKMKGKVTQVIIRGEKVFDGHYVVAKPGFGDII